MRLEIYAASSVALAGAVIANVFRSDRYFYVACTHLTSNTVYLMVRLPRPSVTTLILCRFS